MMCLSLLLSLLIVTSVNSSPVHYEPTWESIDSRPLPLWYDEGKIGVFIHLGVYSVPAFYSEWFWCYLDCGTRAKPEVVEFMEQNYRPGATYQHFVNDFKLTFFNATEWVELFEAAGAKYTVLTAKHHEGFTLWPSKYSYSWNSVDMGPGRDIVGEFASAVRNSSQLRLGLYHSFFEWFHPLLAFDSANNHTTQEFTKAKGTAGLYELVELYEPDLIWSDGDPAPVDYWDSLNFLAWLYNESPVKEQVVVNDRWGEGTSCEHGGFLNCADRFNNGSLLMRKWENAMTLDRNSWGYRRNLMISDVMSIEELLNILAQTIGNGGNLLVNVGSTADGTIPPIFQERLLQMGQFLNTNGEAVYNTRTWFRGNDSVTPDVYYTRSENNLYVIFTSWPSSGILVLSDPVATASSEVHLFGHDEPLDFEASDNSGLEVFLPNMARVQHLKHAWALSISHVGNLNQTSQFIGPDCKDVSEIG